jgi:protein-S-isoprenylcysteine O-methyltransferase Ste14
MKWLELKLLPPVQFALFACAMWLLATSCPFAAFVVPFRYPLALLLAGMGGVLGGTGVWSFLRARTTIHPHRPEHSSALVTTGLYRISRNPMYLGLLLILAGWAVALSNGLGFLLLPGFVACMNRLQIGPEERILRKKFGTAFDDYCRSVRRWL